MAKDPSTLESVVLICTAKDCKKRGAKELYDDIRSEIRNAGCSKQARVLKLKCTDYCKRGPVVILMPQNQWLLDKSTDEILEAVRRGVCTTEPKP